MNHLPARVLGPNPRCSLSGTFEEVVILSVGIALIHQPKKWRQRHDDGPKSRHIHFTLRPQCFTGFRADATSVAPAFAGTAGHGLIQRLVAEVHRLQWLADKWSHRKIPLCHLVYIGHASIQSTNFHICSTGNDQRLQQGFLTAYLFHRSKSPVRDNTFPKDPQLQSSRNSVNQHNSQKGPIRVGAGEENDLAHQVPRHLVGYRSH